jgi:exopolyphosphatase / guanosine-5'-triphosphate,3'-diphosphate pyrophosphatase
MASGFDVGETERVSDRSSSSSSRRRAVIELATRCEWHEMHSRHVAKLTLSLFDQLRPLHKLNAADRELIHFAALLHDIGWHIAGAAHHKHSAHLIRHGLSARVFTTVERNLIAAIARYHRKTPPRAAHKRYACLTQRQQRLVATGAALLRIADGLDRSHRCNVSRLVARCRRNVVQIDLELKTTIPTDIHSATAKSDLFNELFRRPVTFATLED